MRLTATALLACIQLVPAVSSGQVPTVKGASMEARRANSHYKSGWDAMRKEAWDHAASEFQSAIDSDGRFALAYYSLGRAEMGRRNFDKAITAYLACRDLYLHAGGERFSSQFDAKRRIEDRMLEYQTAIQQADQTSAIKAGSQSQQLYVGELRRKLMELQQALDRSGNVQIDTAVPYFIPMALGAAYFRSGRFADAEREDRTALGANPASGETHNNLAVLYLTTGRYDEAAAEVTAAEKVGFKVPEALKGDILAKLRNGAVK